MNIYKIKIAAILLLAASLSACVSNLASKVDLGDTAFVVGTTTNKEVVGTLGLPEKVTRENDGTEKYFYAGAAKLTGFVVGGAGGGAHGTSPGVLDTMVNESMTNNGAVYVFDKNGILISENSPRTRKSN